MLFWVLCSGRCEYVCGTSGVFSWIPVFGLICLSVQLIDLSQVFLSTEIEFLRSALSQPGGSVQAICVPSGAVRNKPFPVERSTLYTHCEVQLNNNKNKTKTKNCYISNKTTCDKKQVCWYQCFVVRAFAHPQLSVSNDVLCLVFDYRKFLLGKIWKNWSKQLRLSFAR